MPTARPFAYNTGSQIAGTQQIGNLAIGYPTSGFASTGLKWWNGPDEELGYVIAHQSPLGDQPNQFSIPAYVGFWRSPDLTDPSFIDLAQVVSKQTFSSATGAAEWLTNNGYWTSYADLWNFSGSTLSWPSNTTGYTLYTGSFTSVDDGYTSTPITSLESFEMANQGASTSVYVSTNGYITFGGGSGNIISSPQQQQSPASVVAQTGDLWLSPGLTMDDGDVQNVYYQTGGTTGKSYIKFIVYCGTYGSTTVPKSWILNFYKDSQNQWLVVRVKSNAQGSVGPYNVSDVSQPASTTSMVWRGDLNGENWTYMGTGSVV